MHVGCDVVRREGVCGARQADRQGSPVGHDIEQGSNYLAGGVEGGSRIAHLQRTTRHGADNVAIERHFGGGYDHCTGTASFDVARLKLTLSGAGHYVLTSDSPTVVANGHAIRD